MGELIGSFLHAFFTVRFVHPTSGAAPFQGVFELRMVGLDTLPPVGDVVHPYLHSRNPGVLSLFQAKITFSPAFLAGDHAIAPPRGWPRRFPSAVISVPPG